MLSCYLLYKLLMSTVNICNTGTTGRSVFSTQVVFLYKERINQIKSNRGWVVYVCMHKCCVLWPGGHVTVKVFVSSGQVVMWPWRYVVSSGQVVMWPWRCVVSSGQVVMWPWRYVCVLWPGGHVTVKVCLCSLARWSCDREGVLCTLNVPQWYGLWR